jgi:HPt (histidine-containing phosphotransfer) domain-containing protein
MSVVTNLSQLDDRPGHALFRELFQIFVEIVPKRIQSLRNLIGRGDLSLVQDQAHALKSSGSNLGFEIFCSLCSELENDEQLTVEAANAKIQEIEIEFRETQQAVIEYLGSNIT